MNRTKIILAVAVIAIVLAGCNNPALVPNTENVNVIVPDDAQLVGTWESGTTSWLFTAGGHWEYYHDSGATLYDQGFYYAYPDEGRMYIESQQSGNYVWWEYMVDETTFSRRVEGSGSAYSEFTRVE